MGDRQRSEPEPPAIDVLVEAGDWPPPAKLRRIARRAISRAVAVAAPRLAHGSELSLVFSDDARVRKLNRRYRGKDKPTNVLSFPGSERKAPQYGPLLGDIVLGHETVAREAARDGIAFDDHVTHLLVHGFLHLVGHDHMEDEEATVMENIETAILGRLGIADPYAGRDPEPAAARRERKAAAR